MSIFDCTLRLRDVDVDVLLTPDPVFVWTGLDLIRYLSEVRPDLFSGGADPTIGPTDAAASDWHRRTL